MPKTALALFKDPSVADEVVRDIESLGFPRNEVRTLGEPLGLGVTSIAELDFEVELFRELERIGATRQEAEAWVEGLRHGGVLVFATGSDERVDRAAEMMNRHGGVGTEETTGSEPHLPSVIRESEHTIGGGRVQTGRIRQPSDGVAFFVW
jgi:hypothetical protein